MRTALLKILKEGSCPGISNRLSPEDQWFPTDDELRTSDRQFLRTWLADYADHSAWEKLITAANRFKKSGTFRHHSLIWCALRARRLAEDARSGIDPLYVERQNRHKELLEVEAQKHARENCAAVASCDDGVDTAMKDSDDLACFPEQADRLGTRKRAWNGDFDELQLFLGAIGNLYWRKQLSPPFLLKEYATRWIADGIPLAHCVEQVRKHLDDCRHQYRVGSGDKGISWVDRLIRTTWQSSNPQLKRAHGSQRGR